MRFFISGCSPDHDIARMTSSGVIMPRSPWLASAACTKKAGVPVEASVAAILRATWPDLPRPVTINRPLAPRMRLAAAVKPTPRSDCNAAASAVMPLPSASSVRRADCTAASASSVPDEFVISGFDLDMSGSREGASVSPEPLLSMAGPSMRPRGGPQPPINHNCFNSINDVFHRGALARGWNPSFKRMIWLGYFYRDLGSGKGPPQARKVLARGVAMPRTGPRAGCVGCALRPGPDAHHGIAASRPRRLRVAAGISPAPNQRADRRCDQRYDRRCRQRRRASRQGYARAVADRQYPDLWPSRRQRRIHFRLRLTQSHAQEAKILSRPGPAEAAAGSRQPRAGGFDGAAAVVGPAIRDRQQDADPARDGRHGGGPAAAQASEDR